jgi:hypothetical protein
MRRPAQRGVNAKPCRALSAIGAHRKSELKVDRVLRHVAWQVAPWPPTGRTVFRKLPRLAGPNLMLRNFNPNVAPNSKLVPRLSGMGVRRMSRTDFPPEADLPEA